MNWLKNFLAPAGGVKQDATTRVRRYRLTLPIGVIGLMIIFTLVGLRAEVAQAASGDTITPPPFPTDIQVEQGNEAYLLGRGVGTQNYVCAPCDPTKANCPLGVALTLFTPQATLFDDQNEQLITHFFSPSPSEDGVSRVAWQDSRDTSTVWA